MSTASNHSLPDAARKVAARLPYPAEVLELEPAELPAFIERTRGELERHGFEGFKPEEVAPLVLDFLTAWGAGNFDYETCI